MSNSDNIENMNIAENEIESSEEESLESLEQAVMENLVATFAWQQRTQARARGAYARLSRRTLTNSVNNSGNPRPPVGVVVLRERLDNPGSASNIAEVDAERERERLRDMSLAEFILEMDAVLESTAPHHRDPSSSRTAARTRGGGGDAVMTGVGVGSSFDADRTSVLIRASLASVPVDSTGRDRLERFRQDFSNTLQSGVNIMQSIMAELGGNGGTGEPLPSPLNLESSGSRESEIGDGEAEWSGIGFPELDYFADAESDESDEGRLLELLDTPRSPHPSHGRGRAGDEETGTLTRGRRQVNRPGSPATVEFFQSIGIPIDKEDEVNLANGFRDIEIMACPKPYYPEGEPVESEAPEPFSFVEPEAEPDGSGAGTENVPLPELVSLDDLLGSEDEAEVSRNTSNGRGRSEEKVAETVQDSWSPSNYNRHPSWPLGPLIELDLESGSEDEEEVSRNTINGRGQPEDKVAETVQDSCNPINYNRHPSWPLGPLIELDLESGDEGTDSELEALIKEYKREKKARQSTMVNNGGAPE